MSKDETSHAAEFLLSEAPGTLSRENVTILSGQNLAANAVLGLATNKYKDFDPDANDGSQTAVAVLLFAVDATGGDAKGTIIARLAEIDASLLVWKTGVDSGEQATALASLALKLIIAR